MSGREPAAESLVGVVGEASGLGEREGRNAAATGNRPGHLGRKTPNADATTAISPGRPMRLKSCSAQRVP